MPLYEYECDACGHRFEKIQKFSDPLEDTCPKCGGPVHKLMSSPAIQFKGSGFYITDYAKKEHIASAKADGATADGAKADTGESRERKSEAAEKKSEAAERKGEAAERKSEAAERKGEAAEKKGEAVAKKSDASAKTETAAPAAPAKDRSS